MKKQIVKQLLMEYNSDENIMARFKARQKKLIEWKEKYGVTPTAYAMGIKESSLLVYCRSKEPCSISDASIAQAEFVFNHYSE